MKKKGRISEYISLSFLIMITMIGVLILFITLISALSYSETRQNLEHDWEMSMVNTDRHLADSLILVAHGFRLFDLTYDSDLKEAFLPFLHAYNISTGEPLTIDIGKIRSGLSPKIASHLDFYIIDENGIVINTTYIPDKGLDFKKWPEVYNDITDIRLGNSFKSDRSVLGFNANKKVRKFAYLPTPDHRYILELSTIIEEYPTERAKFSYLSVADSLLNTSPIVKSITLYDKMVRPIKKGSPTSEEINNATRDIVETVFQDQTVKEMQNLDKKTEDAYFFIKTGGNETVSDNMLDLVARVTYDRSSYESKLQSTLNYHLLIAIVNVILGIFVAYLLTRFLTRPINRIIEDIAQIAKGDLDYPIHNTGSPEFTRLEGSINLLVNSLKMLIEALQENEVRLIASEHRYRSLIENQNDLIIRFDTSGTILFVNDTFCSFFGLSSVTGTSLFGLGSDEIQAEISDFLGLITEKSPSAIIEHQVTLRDGQKKWLQWCNSGIFTGGNIIEYQAVGRDITIRREVENALRESEEKYRSLISNLPDYIIVHRKGVILFVNELISQILGYSFQEMIGSQVFLYIPDEQHQMSTENIQRRMAGEHIPEYELHLKQRSGTIRIVTVRASIIPFEGGPALLTVLTDITDKKNSEQKIRKGEKRYRKLIEQLNEGIVTTDENALITFTNIKLQQMLKYSDKELSGKPILSFITPEDIQLMQQRIYRQI
ncbi:MAG: PAS domain S-box protein, partial [Methanobacteriota archaeon]